MTLRWLLLSIVGGFVCASGVFAQAATDPASFTVLCYHDVRDDVDGDLDPDRFAVATDALIAQFEWMNAHGFHPVSLDDVLAAQRGEKTLPDRAVLLSFDDGLRSVYTRVFPLLKLYRYPALVSIVGAWLEVPAGETVLYGDIPRPREDFLAWSEIREMVDSGLVEVASHSFNLHRGIRGNPQGNLQPAAVTRLYDSSDGSYESEGTHLARVREDLSESADLIEARLGARPRAIVWPYGAFSQKTETVAAELGMTISFGLREGENLVGAGAGTAGLKRLLIEENPSLGEFVDLFREPSVLWPLRAAHVDLDYVYDPDPVQQERNLGVLLDRIRSLQVSAVFLQAFADPDADGTASSLYFPNRHLPMRADLFNRVTWQLKTRAEVSVYAWMPVLAFDLEDEELSLSLRVEELVDEEVRPTEGFYRRLSPYKPEARRILREIYADLGANAPLDGVLYHDDGYLGASEDAAALGALGIDELPSVEDKARLLCELTDELTAVVEQYRPGIESARNLYASVLLDDEGPRWFAQDYAMSLEHYDHVAVMAMPYMEQAENPKRWLEALSAVVARHPLGFEKTVFEIQSVDWRTGHKIPTDELAAQLEQLQNLGVRHLGYYPDDFLQDHPALEVLRPAIAIATYPHRRP